MIHPPLPSSIKVLPGTDVEGEWTRFAPFEAMHHLHEICNPMTHASLNEVLSYLAPEDGDRMIDIACGHGELPIRSAELARIDGVGLDLSPWVLARALDRSRDRDLLGTVEWWLGDGSKIDKAEEWDVAACLGASWIWHGFKGTLAALVSRTRPGGRIAIGDLRTKIGVDPSVIAEAIGPGTSMTTEKDQVDALRAAGLEPVHCYVSPEDAWAGYHALVIESADTYAGPEPAVDARAMAREWQREFEKDRKILEWTVWIARKPGHPASP